MSRRRCSGAGFTVVELLVAIFICALLMALLLPAVQSARAAAQRIACQSQLKQLGVALHNYHGTHGAFPPGSYLMGPGFPMQSGWGWGAMILPSVEQGPLYERLDFRSGTAVSGNRALIETPLAVFRCPADEGEGTIHCTTWEGVAFELASGNFCGSESVLGAMSRVRMADIRDGTSQTLLLGERPVQPGSGGGLPFTSAWCGQVAFENAYEYRSVPYLHANRAHPINGSRADPSCFGSQHAGGANFVMADGSIRFLNENLDGSVFEALGTIGGGEPVSLP